MTSLHWFIQLKRRTVYKNPLLTLKAINNLATLLSSIAKYLLLHPTHPQPARLTTIGSRAFSHSASRLWNSPPQDIQHSKSFTTFKSHLKMPLFQKSLTPLISYLCRLYGTGMTSLLSLFIILFLHLYLLVACILSII